MRHTIGHGSYGESVLIYGPTPDDVEFEIMEYQAEHPDAIAGPIVLRVTGDYGACVDNTKRSGA